jgi:hypothetical protein
MRAGRFPARDTTASPSLFATSTRSIFRATPTPSGTRAQRGGDGEGVNRGANRRSGGGVKSSRASKAVVEISSDSMNSWGWSGD